MSKPVENDQQQIDSQTMEDLCSKTPPPPPPGMATTKAMMIPPTLPPVMMATTAMNSGTTRCFNFRK
ncbi:unnamed protein product [Rhizophagus irregularis]|uniref:Uncharacterized protein n=1 Tax=Rhizophagus irregularis TaxID=588596 RepID=A0A2I1GVI9_9GLOM|nr:hypothetical protein RhiirA4_467236 [Rhizophagus irregularis]CAB4426219.1 unnamed protein product [Rhizophagus irregularis]CAB4426516.1 unnamed protein product [Rhizophagus irregularis]